ncbi:hypothetical protein [Vibrio sp. EJY3]|uniref:hypothetical protein n=1 Tax=Vibrio sp. (strain EJY3) TaxID=1116375 RepID=UPI000243B5DB|nr:hypothetical protein [Vibrio sp. EJY3]AEX21969.1 hypothetical protein VEJY3_07395 [Vibrio sp. EJY3]
MNKCPICSKFRNLDIHLFELAAYCESLDNTISYNTDEGVVNVHTQTIGEWLKLAAQLENVKINTWKFADDSGCYCRPAADIYDSDMKYSSSYSTALTRFIFVSNALEEMYRYVVPFYNKSETVKNKNLRKPSMQTTALIDICDESELPQHFHHKVDSLTKSIQMCSSIRNKPLTGMKGVKPSDYSYGLHLIRNIRNYVAHGVFPIANNPELDLDFEQFEALNAVLLNACRAICFYIQVLLNKYNQGMQSYDHDQAASGVGKEFDYFRKHCTPELALNLHLMGGFSFQDPFGDLKSIT